MSSDRGGRVSGLLTGLYELTMAAGYVQKRFNAQATFELFVRHLPSHRNYLVAAGLEQALRFLENVRFSSEDISYLRSLPLFRHVESGFFEFLERFRFTGIQSRASPSAVRKNVSTVQTDGARFTASCHDFVDSSAYVMGIHEQRGLFRQHIKKIAERRAFVIVRHDPRMRLGSIYRDSEQAPRIRVGCPFAAAYESGAGGKHTSFNSMRASRSELDHRSASRGPSLLVPLCWR